MFIQPLKSWVSSWHANPALQSSRTIRIILKTVIKSKANRKPLYHKNQFAFLFS